MTEWMQNSGARAMLFAALLLPCVPGQASAQEEDDGGWSVGVAGEVVSQYVWRGLLLHDKVSVQPDVFASNGGLSVGVWSSWPLEGDVNEIDTYLSWFTEVSAGELGFTVTDYYYPFLEGDAGKFTNFDGVVDGEATGAHTVELMAEFSPNAVPLTFTAAWNAYNDPDHALYAAVSTGFTVPNAFDVGAEAGFLLKDSENYYGADAGLLHYGVNASRGFALGSLEPYVSVAFVRNHAYEENYWVFAIGF